MCSGFLSQVFAVQTTKLEGVEVNSVGDNISESGIDEGILSKRVAAGPLADKKVLDMPYQVNTISKEVLDHQGVQGFEDAVRYFPSAQIQYRGGAEIGRPQTRGFQGSVVGNVLWDGFYSTSTTAVPMAMFESLQFKMDLLAHFMVALHLQDISSTLASVQFCFKISSGLIIAQGQI